MTTTFNEMEHPLPKCIHCSFPSKFISSGLCHECIRLKLIAVERLIMEAPCENDSVVEDECTCVSCRTKLCLVAITNQFANPKEKTA